MSNYAIEGAEFKLFAVLWNQQQGRKTPQMHLKMADWLEKAWLNGDKRLLLMAFRSAGKSTIVGLFAAWLIYQNPNIRILVLAADFTLAKKMVRNVKRIIERHPLTAHLKPKAIDQWASDRFTVNRELELRDPSMMARGIGSNITGSRADIVICDDVEVPNTCDSAAKREDLRERLSEISYVLVSGGTQLYVGTPHDYYSIYADVPRSEIGEEFPFLDGFKRLSLPIIDENNEIAWQERYSNEDIEQIKKSAGPNKFESQMMLKPVNIMQGRLNPDLLQSYDDMLEYDPILGSLFIGHHKMISASCWWDPAFGSAKGDSSVMAVIFADEGGNYYLHHLEYICVNENDEIDEATQQAIIVAELAKELYLPCISVETNGIGRFLPNILRNKLANINAQTRVMEQNSTKAKAVRIIEGFDAIMAAGRLYVNRAVFNTPFMMEMREWRPSMKSAADDGLDAVAGALSQQPDRLERKRTNANIYNWQQGSRPHTAKSDFEV